MPPLKKKLNKKLIISNSSISGEPNIKQYPTNEIKQYKSQGWKHNKNKTLNQSEVIESMDIEIVYMIADSNLVDEYRTTTDISVKQSFLLTFVSRSIQSNNFQTNHIYKKKQKPTNKQTNKTKQNKMRFGVARPTAFDITK